MPSEIGSTVVLLPTGSSPGAQAIGSDVPAGANLCLAFLSGSNDASMTLTSLASNFTAAPFVVNSSGGGSGLGGQFGVAKITSSGSGKTITPVWSATNVYGPLCTLVYLSVTDPDQCVTDLSAPGTRLVMANSGDTTPATGSVTSTTSDIIYCYDAKYSTSGTLPGTDGAYTSVLTQASLGDACSRLSKRTGAATSTSGTTTNTEYSALVLVAVRDAGGGGGTQTLTFPLTTNTSTVYPPTVVQSGSTQNLTFPLTANTSTIYAPTVRQIPVLSSISATARTNALIRAQATTNVATGTLYAVWTTTSTQPSAAQIMAGQNHTGAAASAAANVAVSSTGAKTLDGTGLTQLQLYYQWVFHSVGGGLGSNIGASTATTFRDGDTAANVLANTGPVGGNPAGTLYALAGTLVSTDWVAYRTISGPTPSGGTLTEYVDGRFTYVGGAAAVWVIQPEVNGVDDGGGTITVNLYDQTLTQTLAFPLTTNTSTVYPPTVLRGTVTLGFPLTTNTSTVYPPTVVQAGATQNLAFPLTTNISTVYPPTVVQGAGGTQTLTFPLTTNTSTVYPPIVANAPALSNPTGAAVGHAGAAGSVDTTGADGTLFYIATTNSTESVATVLAGSSQAVLGSGTQNVSVGGLTAETAYYLHYVHRSAAGVTSTRVSSAQFTTAATPVAGDNVAQTMSISIGLSL